MRKLAIIVALAGVLSLVGCAEIIKLAEKVLPDITLGLADKGVTLDSAALLDALGNNFLCLEADGVVVEKLTGLPSFLGKAGGFIVNDLIGVCPVAEPEVTVE